MISNRHLRRLTLQVHNAKVATRTFSTTLGAPSKAKSIGNAQIGRGFLNRSKVYMPVRHCWFSACKLPSPLEVNVTIKDTVKVGTIKVEGKLDTTNTGSKKVEVTLDKPITVTLEGNQTVTPTKPEGDKDKDKDKEGKEKAEKAKQDVWWKKILCKLPSPLEVNVTIKDSIKVGTIKVEGKLDTTGVDNKKVEVAIDKPITVKLEGNQTVTPTKPEGDKDKEDKEKAKKAKPSAWWWKPALGAAISATAYIIDARVKERTEKLKMIDDIRRHLHDHRTKAQEVINTLRILEVEPRFEVYMHLTKDQLKEYDERNRQLLEQLKYNEFLTERLNKIKDNIKKNWGILDWPVKLLIFVIWRGNEDLCTTRVFMGEVKNQLEELEKEMWDQHDELFIANELNAALCAFGLKRFDLALEHIQKAKDCIERSNSTDCIERSNSTHAKAFTDRAIVHAWVVKGKIHYGRALYCKDSNEFTKSIECFKKVITLSDEGNQFAKAAKAVACCYAGYAHNQRSVEIQGTEEVPGSIDSIEGLLLHIEANKHSPNIPTTLDGLGYGLHVLSKTIESERSTVGVTEAQLLTKYEKILRALRLLDDKAPTGVLKLKQDNTDLTFQKLPFHLATLALEKYNRALELTTNTAAILAHRGWLFLDLAKMQDNEKDALVQHALDDFEGALVGNPDPYYPVARAGRGVAKHRQNKSGEAFEDLAIAHTFYKSLPGEDGQLPYMEVYICGEVKNALPKQRDKLLLFRGPYVPSKEKEKEVPLVTLIGNVTVLGKDNALRKNKQNA